MKDVNTGRIGRFFEAIRSEHPSTQDPRSREDPSTQEPIKSLSRSWCMALGTFLDLGSWFLDLLRAIIAAMNTAFRTALLLILCVLPALSQPNTNQSRQRPSLPPGVKVLRDLEYGQASG